MARNFTHMGPTGAGQMTKLCNQVIVGCAMAVLAEATRLAVNAGIDAKRLPEALAGGFADSIPLQLFVPRMVQGIHSPPLGHIHTMLKDLDTVVAVAQDTSTPVPMAAASRRRSSAWARRCAAPMPTRWRSTSCRRPKSEDQGNEGSGDWRGRHDRPQAVRAAAEGRSCRRWGKSAIWRWPMRSPAIWSARAASWLDLANWMRPQHCWRQSLT